MPKISAIIDEIEAFAPLYLQEEWDNSGLQVGNKGSEAKGAILCLDITDVIIDEAIERGCNLVISHHPLLFRPLKKISGNSETEKIVIKAIKNDIALYSGHTSMDSAWGGVSHILAQKIGLTNVKVLDNSHKMFSKLVTFVPKTFAYAVRESLFEVGAGTIGNYDKCSYNLDGRGTFRALYGAKPFVGEIDELHTEDETRIEVLFPTAKCNEVIKTLIEAHPYEEPAFDIFSLENDSKYTGIGVIGDIDPEAPMAFLNQVKEDVEIGTLRYYLANKDLIKRVAICGGSGAYLTPKAISEGADIFLTGDIKYHDFTSYGKSISLADIGHYESEQFTKEIFYNIIKKKFPTFATYYSEKEKNPINYL